MLKSKFKSSLSTLPLLLLFTPPLDGQQNDKAALTLDRIFSSNEFRSETFGPARWLEDGSAYTTLEPSAGNKEASDIIRYEATTGARSILIAAASLIPKGAATPLI